MFYQQVGNFMAVFLSEMKVLNWKLIAKPPYNHVTGQEVPEAAHNCILLTGIKNFISTADNPSFTE